MEFLGRETVEACRGCGEVLSRAYWRVDGDVVCAVCAEERRLRAGRVARGFVERGLVFGWVAAVVSTFVQAGWWGLLSRIGERSLLRLYLEMAVALGAGLVVGIAVRLGSGRRGGVVLQGMAALLVYFAALGSVALWHNGSAGAFVLRTVLGVTRTPVGMPPMVDVLFAMGIASAVNREGRRMAVSGPFRYASR